LVGVADPSLLLLQLAGLYSPPLDVDFFAFMM
jgi:hypothetical protein